MDRFVNNEDYQLYYVYCYELLILNYMYGVNPILHMELKSRPGSRYSRCLLHAS